MKKECTSKILILFLIASLMLFSSINLITAQETVARDLGRTTAAGIATFLDTLKLNPTALSTILLGILLWIIIYSVVIKIVGRGGTFWGNLFGAIVSLIIVILSFIYLPENFVEAIVLQYGAMGAAILAVIPFLILLYFSLWVTESLLIARATWFFYIVYYLAIFVYKIGTLYSEGTPWTEYVPYGAAVVAGILIIIFLRGIRRLVFKGELEDITESGEKVALIGKVLHQLQRKEAEASYGGGGGLGWGKKNI